MLIPLESRTSQPAPVTTTARLAPDLDLETPPPPEEPEFEIPEEQPEDVEVREDLTPPPEEVAAHEEEWDQEQEEDLRERVRDTIFCPDPRSASGRFRPSRGRPRTKPAEEPVAAEPPAIPVRRPPVVEPPPPPPTPAAILAHVAPVYPRSARERGVEGVVTLRVVVEANGEISDITIARSSGSALLDRAAVAAVEKWEFRPATMRGQPVRSTLDLPPIRFRLTD